MTRHTDTNSKREPHIRVEGISLNDAQAMTLRVALESFASQLNEHGLGDDAHGQCMTEAYLTNIDAIRQMMRLA